MNNFNSFLYRLRNSLAGFMYGRYGMDPLNIFIMWIYIGFTLISFILHNRLINLLILVLPIIFILRCLSKNHEKRRAENQKYLSIKTKFTSIFSLQKLKWRDRKTHVYRRCPSCKANIRLPKRKGTHNVVCPKCRAEFHVSNYF